MDPETDQQEISQDPETIPTQPGQMTEWVKPKMTVTLKKNQIDDVSRRVFTIGEKNPGIDNISKLFLFLLNGYETAAADPGQIASFKTLNEVLVKKVNQLNKRIAELETQPEKKTETEQQTRQEAQKSTPPVNTKIFLWQ